MCVATLIAASTFGGSAHGRAAEATTHAPSWPARALVGSWSTTPLRIIGGTLTPVGGSKYDSAAAEAERQAVNAWIRTSGAFDGVADFDAAVRDALGPARFLPAYDSGDHPHPDDAGYQAMADAVDLRRL
ncbi:MAG: GDSL-like Lipase/Acylhydrolase [Actinoallomurus sp.]|jgi:lysophospholipase L1-like esterase|nr:GDSL-like Lipase/Acylhydrolase [Actinoallomurus sp.]